MEYNKSTNVTGLLFEFSEIKNIEDAKILSDFCENTCSNIFAFSPYELRIDRDDFLLFQVLSEDLKEKVNSSSVLDDKISKICTKLFFLYENLMHCCWKAFLLNSDIKSDAGIFVVNQMCTVVELEKRMNPTKKI